MQVTLKVKINIDNVAFKNDARAEVMRIVEEKYDILHALGEIVEAEPGAVENCYLRDINENTCGEYTVIKKG